MGLGRSTEGPVVSDPGLRERPGLVVEDLTVVFAEFTLGPIRLEFGEGIVAVLGPNGSGKTTLLRAMNGLVPGAKGRVLHAGTDLRLRAPDSLRRCAFVSDGDDLLFPEFSLHEFWGFCADIRSHAFGEDRERLLHTAYDLADRLALDPGGVRMGEFSLGMRRKAQLITGLMGDPDVLMVDEPQNGLDFVSSQEVRRILREARDQGTLVIMSNHDLDSVARIADSIVVLRQGVVVGQSEEHFATSDDCETFVARHFR